MKHTLSLLILLLVWALPFGCSDNNPFPEPYKPAPTNSNKCTLLSFTVKKANNAALKRDISFSLDSGSNTWSGQYLSWIPTEDPELIIPTFTTDGEKVLVNGAEVISNVTPISFAEDITIVVEAENGDTKSYTVSLVCPQINTELPVMHFEDIVASQITSKENYIKSKLEMYSPDTKFGWWLPEYEEVEIRGRGNSTWELPKKPYRVKFPDKHSPIGLSHTQAKSWTILAQHMDKSLLRNHLALLSGAIMFDEDEGYHDPKAVMFTPCSQHVNIYFKGEYYGIYQMSDHVEQGHGRVDVEDLTKADGTSRTGGYMIESSIQPDNSPSFHSNQKNITFLMKYPDDEDYDETQRVWIDTFVGGVEDALYGSNFKDKTNGWRKFLDEKTMADFIIVKEFVGDPDGYISTRCYKRDGVEKLFFGPIWDCDKGWANDPRIPLDAKLMMDAGFKMNYVEPDWFQQVWKDEEFRKFVYNRWMKKKDELVDMVMRELDTRPSAMAKSLKANFSVWDYFSQGSEGRPPAPTYQQEIERLRQWTIDRCAVLDSEFNK
jgi:hypothetical protein